MGQEHPEGEKLDSEKPRSQSQVARQAETYNKSNAPSEEDPYYKMNSTKSPQFTSIPTQQ